MVIMRWLIPPVALMCLLSCSPAAGGPAATGAAASPSSSSSVSPDTPCSLVVSAIGYAEGVLLPAGREDEQKFDGGVRGHIAYVWGVLERYGKQLPSTLQAHQETLLRTSKGLSPAATPHKEQVRLLREYNAAAAAVTAGCA